MKQYTGTKTVKAMPMKYIEANSNGAIPEMNECLYNVNPDGYYIEDCGKRYWMNPISFEKEYKIAETFLDRLYIERDELEQRFKALDSFLEKGYSYIIEKVGALQASLLISQHMCMSGYLNILNSRILDIEATKNLK